MFSTTTSGGLKGRYVSSMRTNQVVVDAGPNRGGTAEAPTPGEYFLTGIGSCAVVVMVGEAERLGISYGSIQATAEIYREPNGDHSIAGINLEIATKGMAKADAERLLEIYVDECPVYGVVNRGTTFKINLIVAE